MLSIMAGPFVELQGMLALLDQRMTNPQERALAAPDGTLDEEWLSVIKETADQCEEYCEDLGLTTTLHVVADMRAATHINQFAAALAQFRRTHRAELDKVPLTKLEARLREFYRAEFPFGPEISKAFPLADKELQEASNCLALERFTASAFHVLRSLEITLRGLARCLSIPDPTKPADRNWGDVLKAVKAEIDRRWPTAATRMTGDGHYFEGLYASLDAMKNPYRNATMHVDQWYDEQDAKDIWAVVRTLMRKAASRFDEDGLPLA